MAILNVFSSYMLDSVGKDLKTNKNVKVKVKVAKRVTDVLKDIYSAYNQWCSSADAVVETTAFILRAVPGSFDMMGKVGKILNNFQLVSKCEFKFEEIQGHTDKYVSPVLYIYLDKTKVMPDLDVLLGLAQNS